MTLEAWVNPAVIDSAWRDVIYKGDNNYDNYFVEGTSPNNDSPVGGGTFGSGAFGLTNVTTTGASGLPTNQWSHVAATYDGTQLEFYVNGTQISSRPQTGNIMTSINALHIGGDMANGQYFNGEIDEIRVYNLALTAAQIQADMNLPVRNTPTAPANLTAIPMSGSQVNLSGPQPRLNWVSERISWNARELPTQILRRLGGHKQRTTAIRICSPARISVIGCGQWIAPEMPAPTRTRRHDLPAHG